LQSHASTVFEHSETKASTVWQAAALLLLQQLLAAKQRLA
jgi:hypothetical protein